MKTEHKWLVGKIALIAAMLSLLLLKRTDPEAIGMSIGVIAGIIVILFFRLRNPEKYKSDERLEKLSSKATLWSWTVTFFIVISIYWLNYLGYISMTGTLTIALIFWVMIITIMVFRLYLLRKPE